MRYGRRIGDWMKFKCGDLVVDRADERHVGRVEAIRGGYTVVVTWIETGWRSELPLSQIERA